MPDMGIGEAMLLAGIIGGGTTAASSIYGATKSSGAAKDAAQLQTDAANHAADVQAKANADTLTFQKSQAAQDLASQNATQQANYGQWAAKEGRMSDFGQMLGLAPRQIPAYQPLPGAGGTTSGGQPPAAASGDAVTQALLDNYKALGVTPTGPGTGPTDIAYMAQQAKASLAAGERPLSYWLGPQGRVAQELAKAGGGGGAPMNSPASLLAQQTPGASPTMAPLLTPALQAPSLNSFAQFLSR